ncbi:hypothetical protein C8Q76DRAFT_798372 [Earliella scabrosa]|nr:hypothetical protein C8Q76DRAFT_798372 [Earliella scabrosa]
MHAKYCPSQSRDPDQATALFESNQESDTASDCGLLAERADDRLETTVKGGDRHWGSAAKFSPPQEQDSRIQNGLPSMNHAEPGGGPREEEVGDERSIWLQFLFTTIPWRREYVPTVLKLVGHGLNPWYMDDMEFLKILQVAWDIVFRGIFAHVITAQDEVWERALQEVEKWRNKLAEIAVSTLELFFQEFPHSLSRDWQRALWCEAMILQNRLYYEDPEGDKACGLFRSPFMVPSLAFHLLATEGSLNVIDRFDNLHPQPVGAIALAAAALICGVIAKYSEIL